jgi:hypothetical protein
VSFLKVDPAQLPRIEEMVANAKGRLEEARDRAWPGGVAAFEQTLDHLRRGRAEARARLENASADDALT